MAYLKIEIDSSLTHKRDLWLNHLYDESEAPLIFDSQESLD